MSFVCEILELPFLMMLFFFFASWTVMTWIVVVGSTLVMLLWIIVYSFFSTPDFNEEVTILFGTMTFWSTVFLTATICLGTTLVLQRNFC